MAFVNNYTPPQEIPEDELYGPDPYDINFILPIPPELEGVRGHESIYQYIYFPLEKPSNFILSTESIRRNPGACLLAVIDTTRPDPNHPEWRGSLAGVCGFDAVDTTHLSMEIGPLIILPPFQRTHVASHAVGLMLKYALDLPPSGIGFRRVTYLVSPFNVPSNNLAKRMGFKLEGGKRWGYVMQAVEGYQKVGEDAREGDAGNGLQSSGSHDWALCWDDWENGGREQVQRVLARVV